MPRRSTQLIGARAVGKLQARKNDYLVWDRDLTGFGVRVTSSGRKVYVAQARGPAGSKRISLGAHGDVSAARARRLAREAVRRIKRGEDPGGRTRRGEPTVAELAERFLTAHAEVNCRAKTVELYRGFIDNHIVPALGDKRLGAVTGWDAARLHESLGNTPGAANGTLRVLSQMFVLAGKWELVARGTNPCRSIRLYRLRPRQRFLTPAEYRRLGRVLDGGQEDGSVPAPAVAALRLLMLTGCRRDEILTLRWDDVDAVAGELRLRDSKTGPCAVALTPAVAAVLNGIPRLPGNPWVIVGAKPGRRLMTLKSVWRRVAASAGLDGVRLHDLRHSYASRALACGESLSMIGKLLNHSGTRTTARYAHVVRDAEKAAAARVGDAIASRICAS